MCVHAPQITNVTLLKQPDDPTKLRGYAFIHFTERAMAVNALNDADQGKELELEGRQLVVRMARPQVRGARTVLMRVDMG